MKKTYRCTACFFMKPNECMKPPNAFGAYSLQCIIEKIIAQGAWTRCTACKEFADSCRMKHGLGPAPMPAKFFEGVDAQQRRIKCAKCTKEKEERFFPQQALRKEKRSLERKTGLVCNACRGSNLCKTCGTWKGTSEFRDGQEVCKDCQEIYCCGCGLAKAPKMFSIKVRGRYFGKTSQQVTCSECIEKGIKAAYAPFRKDAKCSECTKELPNKMFRRIKGQRQTKCKDCEKVSCRLCGQEQPGKSFDEFTKMNYFSHGQTAVCYECIKDLVC